MNIKITKKCRAFYFRTAFHFETILLWIVFCCFYAPQILY
ncbi:hypothetical protein CHK_1936 [Christensenella hongkongensis]|uniref:Uncharacterized protein n=1 Tax=Christensenella hongkongensis TaxID=270498 RepID=A0A0M2NJN3_9FIRM|nr:hypothetical protein CHK_1936 [Christensenella hongkongensis]